MPQRNNMAIERIERIFFGNDGKPRKFIKIKKDGSLVEIWYIGYAKDIQNRKKNKNGN